ncbi:uncharacterized protein LOC142240869 [Haematobia irritans]|uniref:uncharacterized protein LOC142240869 n=1 Tax=Haematobia irritans TaxID=7368 RepID=UPI003F50CC20
MDVKEILELNVDNLRDKLSELGLDATGLRADLQTRLITHLGRTAVNSDSEYADASSGQVATSVNVRSMFTLRDIEDALGPFSGDDGVDVVGWLDEFEDNALTLGWDDLQKFVYCKQLLKGAARMFIRSQTGMRGWTALRNALLREFGTKLSSMEIHSLLRNRKKKREETFREYLYVLMELGKPIRLDDASLIHYFIDGIPDTKLGKGILYQARNIEDLKDKLKIYEQIRGVPDEASASKQDFGSRPSNDGRGSVNQKKCYKCGDVGHFARSCKDTVLKCFKCGVLGHKADECPNGQRNFTKTEPGNSCTVKGAADVFIRKRGQGHNRIFKDMNMDGLVISAIIDTGSDISIIRLDIYRQLGEVGLVREEDEFVTAGDHSLQSLGHFSRAVIIDGMTLTLSFFVVRNFVYPAAVGNDVLRHVDIEMTAEGATFKRKMTAAVEDHSMGDFG